jgi:hypothetical protein
MEGRLDPFSKQLPEPVGNEIVQQPPDERSCICIQEGLCRGVGIDDGAVPVNGNNPCAQGFKRPEKIIC